ncbi:hypothetical protein GORHZ_006_00030 [Gordonia rhizosphera NBRC 16068]|uniref:Uncharacterized protein n=2 Tax=Gordonia rhizosphera TaxID=83341 RepID=K6WNM1_9ACTN|nr:hypothetical protein GORHZ_006_00030 [Gordonia rhizosphera NBRC 16068]
MSQADVRDAGGPSDLTVRKLERGHTARPDFVTLGKLDRALKWTAGSAGRALQGGEPTPLPSDASEQPQAMPVDTRRRPAQPVTAIDHGVILRTDALADLTRKGRALDELPALTTDLTSSVAELRHAIDRITRAWIIRQTEIARRDDTLSDLILVLDDHLRSPPTAGTQADIDDLRYLRWLAGYETTTDEDQQRYERRFAKALESERGDR